MSDHDTEATVTIEPDSRLRRMADLDRHRERLAVLLNEHPDKSLADLVDVVAAKISASEGAT